MSSAERAPFNPSTGPWSSGTCPGPFVPCVLGPQDQGLGHLVLYPWSSGPRTEDGLSTGPKDQGRQVQGPRTEGSGHRFRRGFQSSAPSRWEIASAQTARLAITPGVKSNQYWSPVREENRTPVQCNTPRLAVAPGSRLCYTVGGPAQLSRQRWNLFGPQSV